MPKRIQLSRLKGWKMPPDTVKVDRTTRWGNPWPADHDGTMMQCTAMGLDYQDEHDRRLAAVDLYRTWLGLAHDGKVNELIAAFLAIPKYPKPSQRKITRELGGKNLACWCPLDQPCHADVLLKLANKPRHNLTAQIEALGADSLLPDWKG